MGKEPFNKDGIPGYYYFSNINSPSTYVNQFRDAGSTGEQAVSDLKWGISDNYFKNMMAIFQIVN